MTVFSISIIFDLKTSQIWIVCTTLMGYKKGTSNGKQPQMEDILNPNQTGGRGGNTIHPPKKTLECLSHPKMYMVGDIPIQTLIPEGQTSSQGP